MNLKDLDNLQEIEEKLGEIRGLLNPEDSPYVCDAIVTSINDEELWILIEEMLIKMGYKKKILSKMKQIIEKIQK